MFAVRCLCATTVVRRCNRPRLVAIEISGNASEGGGHAIWQPKQLLLQLMMPLLVLLLLLLLVVVCAQFCHNLRMLHIRDTYVDRIIIIIVRITIAGTIQILIIGETRRGWWYRWRHSCRCCRCCRIYLQHLSGGSHRSCRGLYVGVIRRWRVCIAGLDAQLLFVVILLQIALQATRKLQLIDAIIGGIRDNGGTRQLLQRECLAAMQRHGQAGLKEHYARWIFIVLQQSSHCQRCEDARIVAIKAKR